jgi:hypothetical protein
MIRAVRPIDVAALRAFLGRAGAAELTTHTWPKVQPESGHLPLLDVFGQALGQHSSRGMWVAATEAGLVGYAIARARCDGMVWDVEHLHAAEMATGLELLEHLCSKAVDEGARRVFLELPARSPAIEAARRAGFERYAASTLLRLEPPLEVDRASAFSARPRLRADEHALFQLYNATVPAQVRAAEAMTYEEWSALHRGKKSWRPSLVGDRHQFVWELSDGLIGWMEVVYGQKSQYLELLVKPGYESMLDRLVGYSLTQISEKAPVYASARDYQASLASALARAGFVCQDEAEILVRQLAARAPQPQLVPANVLGS